MESESSIKNMTEQQNYFLKIPHTQFSENNNINNNNNYKNRKQNNQTHKLFQWKTQNSPQKLLIKKKNSDLPGFKGGKLFLNEEGTCPRLQGAGKTEDMFWKEKKNDL